MCCLCIKHTRTHTHAHGNPPGLSALPFPIPLYPAHRVLGGPQPCSAAETAGRQREVYHRAPAHRADKHETTHIRSHKSSRSETLELRSTRSRRREARTFPGPPPASLTGNKVAVSAEFSLLCICLHLRPVNALLLLHCTANLTFVMSRGVVCRFITDTSFSQVGDHPPASCS